MSHQHTKAHKFTGGVTAGDRWVRIWFSRTLLVLGTIASLAILWEAREILLLAFFSIVLAVLLSALTRMVKHVIPLSRRWALCVAVLAVLLVLGGIGWLAGTRVQSQVSDLVGQLNSAVQDLPAELGFNSVNQVAQVLGSNILSSVTGYAMNVATALTSVVLVAAGTVFLTANPDLYLMGLVKLFPPRNHRKVEGALRAAGEGLYRWLMAKLIGMLIVGVLVGIGAFALGLPAPIALGLFSGLTEFVPIIGPIIGAVLGLILAVSHGWQLVIWTLLLYTAVQQLESNVIIPKLQQEATRVAPALLLFTTGLFGILFGILGVILASDLTVVAFVLVNKLYVHDVLNESATVPGE